MNGRHDQHIGGARKPRERILLHPGSVERNIGAHFPVILEVQTALVEDFHGFADPLGAFAAWLAEGGIGKHGHTGFITHAARHASGFHGDVGEIFRRRHVMHGGIGDEDCTAARHDDGNADHLVTGLRVDAASHVRQRGGVVSGRACHHCVRITERHHAGGKMVAVVVDQSLHVALQITLALKSGVKVIDIGFHPVRQSGVDDLDTGPVKLDASAFCCRADDVITSEQNSCTKSLRVERDGSAHHLLFFGFCKHHALGSAANLFVNALRGGGNRIAARRQFPTIGIKIGNHLSCDAAFDGRTSNSNRDCRNQARIEGNGNDILRSEAWAHTLIGGRDIVRNVFAGKVCERFGCSNLHGIVDLACPDVERAAEDVGEAQHIVDLVRIIRTAGGHDRIIANAGNFFRRDFRIGIGHGEDDRPVRHGADHLFSEGALLGQAEHDVGSLHCLFQGAPIGLAGVRAFPLVHAFGAALVDHALGIAKDDIVRGKAHGLDQLDTGDGGGTGAIANKLRGLQVAARQFQRIDEAGSGDDGSAMLVVMKDGNVHQFAQPAFDDEAFRCLDILKVDAAEGGAEIAHAVDEFVDIFRIDFEIDGIDIGKALEEHGFALHHRLGGECSKIAKPKDGRAIGNDRHHIAARGVIVGGFRIGGDCLDWHSHTRRIGQRQVALRCHRLGRGNLQLAGTAAAMEVQRFLLRHRGALACRTRRRVAFLGRHDSSSMLWASRKFRMLSVVMSGA